MHTADPQVMRTGNCCNASAPDPYDEKCENEFAFRTFSYSRNRELLKTIINSDRYILEVKELPLLST